MGGAISWLGVVGGVAAHDIKMDKDVPIGSRGPYPFPDTI